MMSWSIISSAAGTIPDAIIIETARVAVSASGKAASSVR